jgi:UDP-glucose-4-epimerase GalE
LTVVEAGIGETATVEATCREHGIDAVMHFAAWLSVGDSVTDPVGYYRNNVVGSLGLLDGLRRAGVTRLIFSSTCATYGEPQRVPIDESHPQQPINSYGETKLAVERALPHFETAYGLKSIALRYFNAAGADPDGLLGEDHSPEIHIIPRAIFAARGTDSLKVFGDDYPTPDGTCLRDYIHVTDLADAHVRALESLEQGGPSARFNVGTGTPHSVREVIEAVARVAGRPVPFTVAPRRAGDPSTLYAANDAIRAALGWVPRHADLDTIVGTAWCWFDAHPDGYGD